MITCDKYVGGYLVVSALVTDNRYGGEFLHSVRYEGYSRREAVANYRDSLTRDGLRLVKD